MTLVLVAMDPAVPARAAVSISHGGAFLVSPQLSGQIAKALVHPKDPGVLMLLVVFGKPKGDVLAGP
jgi:hypothetical protein